MLKKFKTIRPVFKGMPGWQEYHQLLELHNKLIKKKKRSEADYNYIYKNFERGMMEYEKMQ